MATDFDRLVEALHQEVLNLNAIIAAQNEQLNSFAALVKDLVQERETERAQFAALLQQSVETTVTNLQHQVIVALQAVQRDLGVLMGRQ